MCLYCICPVPEPAPDKPSLGPSPHHRYPTNPKLPFSLPSSSSSGNGKRASSSSQLPTQTPPQQQGHLSSASARYPPREVPPRFRQQEHKQLLKRGQPLPAGTLGVLTPSSCSSSFSSYFSSTTANSTTPITASSAVGKNLPGLCQNIKNVTEKVCFVFTYTCCVHLKLQTLSFLMVDNACIFNININTGGLFRHH